MAGLDESGRAELLTRLAEDLVEDPSAFIAGWFVLPEASYFPDPWKASPRGLSVLAMRLHHYLGIAHLRPVIELALSAPDDVLLGRTEVEFVALRGNDACYRVTELHRADDAALALLHEAARAAVLDRGRRAARQGPFRESTEEGELTPANDLDSHLDASLFAIARGLGVLVCIGTHQYRQASQIAGHSVRTEWQHVSYGGLSDEAAAFLLAVHLSVRSEVEVGAVLAHLPRGRADEVRAALKGLDRSTLIEALGLPSEAWPAARRLPVPRLRAPAVADDELVPTERRLRAARAREAPVFRVRATLWAAGALVGVFAGMVSAVVVAIVLRRIPGAGSFAFASLVGCVLMGGLLGRRRFFDTCSDRDCQTRIPPEATQCPGCAREIAGVARSRREALEREEELEEQRRTASKDASPT